jgi:uncharacterized repeat protein (TIGR01451 family)
VEAAEAAAEAAAAALAAAHAELSVTKTDSTHWVRVGAALTYTITVTNDGPADATGLTLTDVLPSDNVSLVSATPTQGVCAGTTTISCDLGTLGSGQSVTVTIVVTAISANGSTDMVIVANTASVSANEPDSNLASNSPNRTTFILGIDAFPAISNLGITVLAVLLAAAFAWGLRWRARREGT